MNVEICTICNFYTHNIWKLTRDSQSKSLDLQTKPNKSIKKKEVLVYNT